MKIESRKAFAVAALIVATGVVTMELSLTPALADSSITKASPTYVASRVEGAFQVVANMTPVAPVRVPMATKGDLPVPVGCLDLKGDAQAECMDVAYELPSEPSIVVETRFGTTSTLTRMDAMTVANIPVKQPTASSE